MFIIFAIIHGAGADNIDDRLTQCASCHGAQGRANDASVPVIWGQNPAYIVKQFNGYREGTRDSQISHLWLSSCRGPCLTMWLRA